MRLGRQLRHMRQSLAAAGDIVLTFDLGDLMDRVRPETEATMGLLNVDMMAGLGVDGWVFGNNEGLTIPVADWPLLAKRSQTVVFGTNLKRDAHADFSFFADHHVYEQQGVRIGVFGLTPHYELPYDMLGVKVLNPFDRAATAVAALNARGCQVIICLSHLGRRTDHQLASEVSGIDVILGSHTHEFMTAAEWENGTAIFQPGKFAHVFGHTVLTLNRESRVTDVVSQPVPVDLHGQYDGEMASVYAAYLPRINQVLSRSVVTLPERLPVVYERESLFANMMADVLYDEFAGDFSVMMTGALNASLLPGIATLEHLLGACPTPTRPLVLGLTGAELYTIFQQGVQRETYMRHGIGFGFRGGRIGYLVVSGATIELTVADDQPLVKRVLVQGEPLDMQRTYRVITCEYLWLSPVFTPFRQSRDVTYQAPLVREVLLARMQEKGRLERARVPRYISS
jgi:2',3'-cyclic-nucleotide 2'-phosphodiesterase (5'-nucleotidase family)